MEMTGSSVTESVCVCVCPLLTGSLVSPQYFEVPFDSNMNRTKNRPLVRGQIRYSVCVCLSHKDPCQDDTLTFHLALGVFSHHHTVSVPWWKG